MLKKESDYRKAFSFRTGMSQHAALLYACMDDQDIMNDVYADSDAENPYHLFVHNPLKQGLYLDTITVGAGNRKPYFNM